MAKMGIYQEGLITAAKHRRMEETKQGPGVYGGELLQGPGPNAGCCIIEGEEEKDIVLNIY